MRRLEEIRELLRPVVDGIVAALGLDMLITNSALAPVIVTRPRETPHPWQARGSLYERMAREPEERLIVDRGAGRQVRALRAGGLCSVSAGLPRDRQRRVAQEHRGLAARRGNPHPSGSRQPPQVPPHG